MKITKEDAELMELTGWVYLGHKKIHNEDKKLFHLNKHYVSKNTELKIICEHFYSKYTKKMIIYVDTAKTIDHWIDTFIIQNKPKCALKSKWIKLKEFEQNHLGKRLEQKAGNIALAGKGHE